MPTVMVKLTSSSLKQSSACRCTIALSSVKMRLPYQKNAKRCDTP